MLLIPAVCLAVFGLLGFRSMTAQVVLLLECCPSAAITSVFAVQFGHDESFAAGSVVLTTLLSIVALPLCALVVCCNVFTSCIFYGLFQQTQISICTNFTRFAVFRAICGQFCQSFFILQ